MNNGMNHAVGRSVAHCLFEQSGTLNLKAMCAPCHLKYDAQHHAETRRKNNDKNTRSEEMDRRRNQGDVSG